MGTRYQRESSVLADFLTFRKMITPILIQTFFWLAVIGCIWAGAAPLRAMQDARSAFVRPRYARNEVEVILVYFVLGPIVLRIVTESIILFFRMNETLTDIRTNTSRAR